MRELTAAEANEIKLLSQLIEKHKDRIVVVVQPDDVLRSVCMVTGTVWGMQDDTVLIKATPVRK